MTDSYGPIGGSEPIADVLLTRALGELPVPEHRPTFWADLETALELEDELPSAVADEHRWPSEGRRYAVAVAIAAATLVLVLALVALSGRQRIVSQDPVNAPSPAENDVGTTSSTDSSQPTTSFEEETSRPDSDLPFDIAGVDVDVEVSRFVTNHPCCQRRVVNIQRMADLVQGAVIRPGESFSLNEYVGKRTEAAGFVATESIEEGLLDDLVGGGVNQYATTLFNAALFAGLEIDEHRSPDLYSSRYPLGRDAALGWPDPDLVITNSSEHDVVIWNSYDETSITVALYSKAGVDVEVGQPVGSVDGGCQVETSTRTRTWPDGRVEQDEIVARYRTGEESECDPQSVADD